MMYDQSDLDNCSLCVWKEARGEQEQGMRAVAHVIFNRIDAVGFPHTLHDVIYQKNAFTSMSVSSDPEYNLQPNSGDLQYQYTSEIIQSIANGEDVDSTLGAHYYADLKYVTSGWFFRNIVNNPTDHPHTVKIGRHDFYV